MPTNKEIVAPGSARWPEFLSHLGSARRCFGTTQHARSALERMPGVDVDGTLREMTRLGGTCDCVIELDLSRAVESLSA